MAFTIKRSLVPKYFIGLWIGLLIALIHVIATMLPLLSQLDGNNFWFSTYNRWISFDSSSWTIAFFWVIPIISALSASQIVSDDIKSGFFWQQISKQGIIKYFCYTFPISFFSGLLTVLIPLLVNLFFAWSLFPTLKPDLILNANAAILPQSTFLASEYYTNPANLVLLYLLLPALLGGGFALFSATLAFFINNQFANLTAGFLITLLLTILATIFPQKIFSPILLVAGVGFGYVPSLLTYLLVYLISLIIMLLFFIWGVRKHAYV
ncbi:hypothetical protein C5Z26_05005 [Lactobacillus sp. CBA3606]|uniref:hypothetical protein n=1 Tax=Lactobacillus sp. CBA3606 TaxID=2099789 RepID=UPI000CFA8292|nr:hypothetical protein [Lactobacillus sp. CBA3606]AVK63499.1 hypothetical protein C5Z26_05005 [Lactobacillus sp. CBA3606]